MSITNLFQERRSSPTSSLTDRRAFGVEASGYQYPLQQISHGPPGIIPSGAIAAGAETFSGHLPTGGTSAEGPRVISTISQYSTERSMRMGQANPVSSPSPASTYSSMNPYRNMANYAQQSFESQPTQLLSEFAPTPRSRFNNAEMASVERGLSPRDSFNENNEAIDFDAIRQPVTSEESCYPPGRFCDREGLLMDASGPMIRTEQRCNSMRLREIIISNIIEGDAESSKRAIQLVAEQELGGFYNVICGTGFFSYIAHADEFCLTATGRVNCYVFSPTCFQDANMDIMKKRRKATHRKSFLNMN
uniref:Ground-like domain-containing protein n=1 Tax=Ascaris lumbricoides TaxID=6252 RepID=A0A0M3IAU8_ASCLU